jgi:hypothetical protein
VVGAGRGRDRVDRCGSWRVGVADYPLVILHL